MSTANETLAPTSVNPPANGRHSRAGEPAWEIAEWYPLQGEWTEDDYLALNTKRIVELSNGCLEFHAMATLFHQLIVKYLFQLLDAHAPARALGYILFAPLPIRLWPEHMREPDILVVRRIRVPNLHKPPDGADLVMEVVSESPEDRKRDLETKRDEYAKAKIQEYWIVDPQERRITVLTLEGSAYRVHGEFVTGMQATSLLLPGFAVDVTAIFALGEEPEVAEPTR